MGDMGEKEEDVFAMLGGVSEQAARRAGGANAPPSFPRQPGLPPRIAKCYYQNDSSSQLRLVQAHVVIVAALLSPPASPLLRTGAGTEEEEGELLGVVAARQRVVESQQTAAQAMLRSSAAQSPLLLEATAKGLRGLPKPSRRQPWR